MEINFNKVTQLNAINKLNEKWEMFFAFLFKNIKKYTWSEHIIEYLKTIYSNKMFCIFFIILISWFWSNLLLKLLYVFMLIDSIVMSLLVLQNNSININSRRLCKNVILMFMININLIGDILSLLLIIFIYMEYSKLINRIIFKFIKFIFKLLSNFIPYINTIYPQIKNLNFEDPDNTIYTDSKAESDLKYFSDSESEIQIKKKYKNKLNYLYTKNNKNKLHVNKSRK